MCIYIQLSKKTYIGAYIYTRRARGVSRTCRAISCLHGRRCTLQLTKYATHRPVPVGNGASWWRHGLRDWVGLRHAIKAHPCVCAKHWPSSPIPTHISDVMVTIKHDHRHKLISAGDGSVWEMQLIRISCDIIEAGRHAACGR